MIARQPVTASTLQEGQDKPPSMPPLPQQRHKVVLVIDLVESVRLMAANEAAVVNQWRGFMHHATTQVLPACRGRLVKSLGDGMLVDAFRNRLPDPRCHKLYFDFGTETLDKDYERFQWMMDAAVAARGYIRGCNWLTCKFAGADHSERAWQARVDIPLEFFLGKQSGRFYPRHWWSAIEDPNKPAWEILPQAAQYGEVILSKRNELGLLSNFAATSFMFCGIRYASLEGFWQSMKYPEGPADPRNDHPEVKWEFTRDEVAQMVAFDAKHAGDLGSENMRKLGIDWVSFNGRRFPYRPDQPGEHYRLIVAATKAKVCQNPIVSSVLLSTGDLILKPDHLQEGDTPAAWRYYDILMQIRRELRELHK